MGAPVSSWPWHNLGSFKYLLYGPLVAKVIHSRAWEGGRAEGVWFFHLLFLFALRGLIHQLWWSFSSMIFLTRKRRIIKQGYDFKQIDKEWDWDNFLIPQAFIGTMAVYLFPSLTELPLWDLKGFFVALLIHAGVSEPLFYWAHRAFHSGQLLSHYHSIHHSSPVPSSFTAAQGTPLEHLLMSLLMGLPLVGASFMGTGSIGLFYAYVLLFDFLRCMGHSNVEIFPSGFFETFPLFRYLIYTPTYHSLHHTEKNSNYCLFMPLFDALGGTMNAKSWSLQKEISSAMQLGVKDPSHWVGVSCASGFLLLELVISDLMEQKLGLLTAVQQAAMMEHSEVHGQYISFRRKNVQVPDFIFLAHVVDVVSSLHCPFVFRSFSSLPFRVLPYILVIWPGAFLVMLAMWGWSKTFLLSFYNLRGQLHQSWVVPRHGFQYFLPFAKDGINSLIENAILRADKMGVKVISLAALNKNEALNGGGTLFVNKHPNLKVRVVHGNTLTAAVILNEIPKDVKEVFLTGATSKLGRAIALYLCRKKVRVLMLTLSTERFQKIQKEAPADCQQYLVQVTKYQAAQNCKTWIVGKWITYSEQRLAPRGTHFHQFVVPPIIGFRRDCTYGKLAAMRLPLDVEGLGMCEYTLDRGVVHACHAGGVVHCLEGWTHNEVGALDVDRIDIVWEAALKHGLMPA